MAVNGVNQRDSVSAAQEEVDSRRKDLERTREGLQDTSLADYARAQLCRDIGFSPSRFEPLKTLSGHTGKIYSLDWSERDTIVSASQDGRLIVWNAITSQKTHAIKLKCPWVMTCAFSADGQAVACGGLDNLVSVFRLRTFDTGSHPDSVLSGHKGYISCCRFVPGKNQILTSSGDHTCTLWDLESNSKVAIGADGFGHTSDVMSLSINKENPSLFVTGSCDHTAKLWDVRTPNKAVRSFFGHRKDVNTVQFLPGGHWFGTGSDDGTCKLFDVRYGYQLQEYKPDGNPQVNAIAFSRSGRILVASYNDQRCLLWDIMTTKELMNIGNVHSRQVSCLGFAPDGSALCTGGWDSHLRVWAYSQGRTGQ